MTGAIAFLVIFSLLIFIHEFGHFLFAKLCGVTVLEFGFGYPPRLLKIGTWRGTEISLNVLPFGGFVRMAEHEPDVPDSLATKSRGTRALVFAGGAIMNVLLAIVLYSITFMTGALTPYEGPGAGVYYVAPGSPAEQAGIMPGDTIVRINNVPVESVDQAVEMIKARLGHSPTHQGNAATESATRRGRARRCARSSADHPILSCMESNPLRDRDDIQRRQRDLLRGTGSHSRADAISG